ncbi:CHASE domain-containing protein [Azohydromonas lata]|uniref:CHASE domain-containing protein n=1 Tax=Azohydromonas lata TaxID=45677 RepID=UPI0014716827|nr:CHASE domain-containing protein [Azohydromonas lata]
MAWQWQVRANAEEENARFSVVVERAAERLRGRMQLYESGVRSARAVVLAAGAEAITLEQFRAAVDSLALEQEFPGARGLAYARRVEAGREAEFLAARRREMPDFHIRELAPHADDHVVVQFIEPLPRNLDALGLDLASEPRRRDAARAASLSGEVQLSAPLRLVQARHEGERAFLLMLPIYEGAMPGDARLRERRTLGWSVVPMVAEEVLKDFDDDRGAFAITLTDVTQPQAPERFFTSATWFAPVPHTLVRQATIRLAGRDWLVQAQALPPFVERLNLRSPANLAGAVVTLSALLALLLYGGLRVEHERRLVRRERTVRAAVVDSAQDAIVIHGLQDEILGWNAAAERLLGWQAHELRGQRLSDLMTPAELREEQRRALERVQQGEPVTPFDSVRLDRSGQRLDVTVSMAPIRDEQGQVVAVATTLHDIRARKAAQARIVELNATLEQQVHQRTGELQSILDCAASAVVATDLQGRITMFNPAAEAMFRLPAAQALGRSVLDFCDPRELEHKAQAMPSDVKAHASALPPAFSEPMHRTDPQPAVDAGQGPRSDWTYVRADGTRFSGLLAVSVLRDAQGEARGLLSVISDLTERKSMEAALQQRTEQAESVSLAKSAFLAHMSHELRTPMNAILGLAHLLGQDGLAPRQAEQVARIDDAARHLLSIINDVLDLSRIDAGKLRLEERDFQLSALLEQVRSMVGEGAAAKGLRLEIEADEAAPWLRGDETRVRQALLNYAGNAVKFTRAGHIVLRARLLQQREDGALLMRFEVEDTGVGIDAQQVARLFEAFEQADTSTTREHGGTGLGLAITRRLAELMGGSAGAQPREGGGSIFWFTACLGRGAAVQHREEAPPVRADLELRRRHAGARVLVAEDNIVNREVALALLRAVELRVDFAEDGQAAVEAARQSPYDLVLMDMQMPVMDGLQATRALRALPGLQNLSILAMTANAFDEDRNACLAAGMDDFVAKPVQPQALYATLLKWLDRRDAATA